MPGGCCRGGASHLQQHEGLHPVHDQQQRGRSGLHLLHRCFGSARGPHTCAAALGELSHRRPPCHSTGLQPSWSGLNPFICLLFVTDLLMVGIMKDFQFCRLEMSIAASVEICLPAYFRKLSQLKSLRGIGCCLAIAWYGFRAMPAMSHSLCLAPTKAWTVFNIQHGVFHSTS